MAEMTWAKHAGTGAVAEVPVEAIPQLRQSGWEPLTEEEIADREQSLAAELAAVEEAMRAGSARPETASETGSRGRAKNTKGND